MINGHICFLEANNFIPFKVPLKKSLKFYQSRSLLRSMPEVRILSFCKVVYY